MAETRIATVGFLLVQGAMGPKSYGLVVTDTRSILALQSSSKAALGAAIGGAVGAAIGQALSKDRGVDVENTQLDVLAAADGAIVIPHEAIERLRVKKSWGTFRLIIEYARPDGKHRKVHAEATVSFQGAKRLGISVDEFAERRGSEIREAYRRALPPEILARVELGP